MTDLLTVIAVNVVVQIMLQPPACEKNYRWITLNPRLKVLQFFTRRFTHVQ